MLLKYDVRKTTQELINELPENISVSTIISANYNHELFENINFDRVEFIVSKIILSDEQFRKRSVNELIFKGNCKNFISASSFACKSSSRFDTSRFSIWYESDSNIDNSTFNEDESSTNEYPLIELTQEQCKQILFFIDEEMLRLHIAQELDLKVMNGEGNIKKIIEYLDEYRDDLNLSRSSDMYYLYQIKQNYKENNNIENLIYQCSQTPRVLKQKLMANRAMKTTLEKHDWYLGTTWAALKKIDPSTEIEKKDILSTSGLKVNKNYIVLGSNEDYGFQPSDIQRILERILDENREGLKKEQEYEGRKY